MRDGLEARSRSRHYYSLGAAKIPQCCGQVECWVQAGGSDRPAELDVQPVCLGKRVADRNATEPTDDFGTSRTLSQVYRQRPTKPPDLPSPAEILPDAGAVDGPPGGPRNGPTWLSEISG